LEFFENMTAEYSSKNNTFYLKRKLLSLCSNKGEIAGEAKCMARVDAISASATRAIMYCSLFLLTTKIQSC
jgi:hypothetical protein